METGIVDLCVGCRRPGLLGGHVRKADSAHQPAPRRSRARCMPLAQPYPSASLPRENSLMSEQYRSKRSLIAA